LGSNRIDVLGWTVKSRTETKLLIERSDLPNFFKWLASSSAKELHPPRQISSNYFDNKRLQMFQETAEGLVPRQKYRIRCYGNHDDGCDARHFMEIKETGIAGRSKSSEEVLDWKSLVISGWSTRRYGICRPSLSVQYWREYYAVLGVRITVDRDISYAHPSSLRDLKAVETRLAVEIKSPANVDSDWEVNAFPFPRVHFSKYESGIRAFGASA
jgi:hypothetical protein